MRNRMLITIGVSVWLTYASVAIGQAPVQPRMEQDASLDNLAHAQGTETCQFGELGDVTKAGTGSQPMILIAGAGFGGDVFETFMNDHVDRYTMYAVTLPGYGGTKPLPMPDPSTSYGELTWHRSAQRGIEDLIQHEELVEPIILAHWVNATLVALRIGLDSPEAVGGLIIVSGVPRYLPTTPGMQMPDDPAGRAALVDSMMAPLWFKTVTRPTWDDNNFLPSDYAIHPLRGLQLWIEASRPALPIHVRYLCETWAQDVTAELNKLHVPTLVVQPHFDQAFVEMPRTSNYLETMLHDSWDGVAQSNDLIRFEQIAGSRVFVMDDQPARLSSLVESFVAGL